ncbi:MAG: hypothetical protein ACUBOA_01115 [Candidatus Loosdrechtia sp.]|uniref:hypothetical protein n=1 Tax=Candidatus Loosdrechtia sp. TaxID=3101272 RepID=UPI003A78D5D2|nr:MAG: hypothetical protein QY305_05085 [Candidatus Jettenia sp. AMX2]
MNEEKNVTDKGIPLKKSVSGKTSSNRRSKKEHAKEVKLTSADDTESALSLIKRIDEIVSEVENTPLKSFGKNNRTKLLQSYENLVLKMVKEINRSRK